MFGNRGLQMGFVKGRSYWIRVNPMTGVRPYKRRRGHTHREGHVTAEGAIR